MDKQLASTIGIAFVVLLFGILLVMMATVGEFKPNDLTCTQAPYQTKCPAKNGGDN
jgi:Na+-transporting methylmalonyl-CoA/oxaloacetate decarboxylase gamma subunit